MKLFEVEDDVGYRFFEGVVMGCRKHPAFGLVYVVRYDDGDEEELFYEELMPVLAEDRELQPIPREVLNLAAAHMGVPSHSTR